MDILFVLLTVLVSCCAVELFERIAQRFLPDLAKEKPLQLWLTGQGAEYKLRRAVRQAKKQHLSRITAICLDQESGKICRLFELANPDLEFDYGQDICVKTS